MILLPSDVSRKIEWAERLLRELDDRVREYAESEPVELEARANNLVTNGLHSWSVWASVRAPPPVELSLLAGDVLQNTRGALDYLARALVETADGVPVDKPGGTQFPILKQRPKKDLSLEGCSDPNVIAKLDSVQPYTVADPQRHALARLNALNNMNKHQSIPVLTGAGGIPAVVAIHDHADPPSGSVAPYARWFFDNDRLDPVMGLFPLGCTPVAVGTFDTVVSFSADAWLTVSLVDELDYYLRVVRDEVVPLFQEHFLAPWPDDVFTALQVSDPSASLPLLDLARMTRMTKEMFDHVSNGVDDSPVLVWDLVPGASVAMGYHSGEISLGGPPSEKFVPRW